MTDAPIWTPTINETRFFNYVLKTVIENLKLYLNKKDEVSPGLPIQRTLPWIIDLKEATDPQIQEACNKLKTLKKSFKTFESGIRFANEETPVDELHKYPKLSKKVKSQLNQPTFKILQEITATFNQLRDSRYEEQSIQNFCRHFLHLLSTKVNIDLTALLTVWDIQVPYHQFIGFDYLFGTSTTPWRTLAEKAYRAYRDRGAND